VGDGGDAADAEGGFARLYGLGDVGAVVIRPDGVVAWRTTEAPADGGGPLADALETVLARRGDAARVE
jgi:hypothetical protein